MSKQHEFDQWLDKWEPGISFVFGFCAAFFLMIVGLNAMLRITVIWIFGLFN
jgi:hypothetical protein